MCECAIVLRPFLIFIKLIMCCATKYNSIPTRTKKKTTRGKPRHIPCMLRFLCGRTNFGGCHLRQHQVETSTSLTGPIERTIQSSNYTIRSLNCHHCHLSSAGRPCWPCDLTSHTHARTLSMLSMLSMGARSGV